MVNELTFFISKIIGSTFVCTELKNCHLACIEIFSVKRFNSTGYIVFIIILVVAISCRCLWEHYKYYLKYSSTKRQITTIFHQNISQVIIKYMYLSIMHAFKI